MPDRFAFLKQRLISGNEEQVRHSWNSLLDKLRVEIEEIKSNESAIIPEIDFKDINHASDTFRRDLKTKGVAVIRGVVPEQEALQYKADLREYIKRNPQTKGKS